MRQSLHYNWISSRALGLLARSSELYVCLPSAMTGHEDLACELIGKKCTAYEECSQGTSGSYSCSQKGKMAQLAAFFTEGGSSDTPFWVWITVALGALLLILIIWLLIRKLSPSSPCTPVPVCLDTSREVFRRQCGVINIVLSPKVVLMRGWRLRTTWKAHVPSGSVLLSIRSICARPREVHGFSGKGRETAPVAQLA